MEGCVQFQNHMANGCCKLFLLLWMGPFVYMNSTRKSWLLFFRSCCNACHYQTMCELVSIQRRSAFGQFHLARRVAILWCLSSTAGSEWDHGSGSLGASSPPKGKLHGSICALPLLQSQPHMDNAAWTRHPSGLAFDMPYSMKNTFINVADEPTMEEAESSLSAPALDCPGAGATQFYYGDALTDSSTQTAAMDTTALCLCVTILPSSGGVDAALVIQHCYWGRRGRRAAKMQLILKKAECLALETLRLESSMTAMREQFSSINSNV